MSPPDTDRRFAGSIPEIYDSTLVPLIFEPYAADLAERARQRRPRRVLEVAAGTGVVTRQLASVLPEGCALVASDLNQPMLDQAAATGTSRPVEWRQADAMALPFEDGSFDAVVCQFGVMFFPEKPRAFAQARRVLRPGGCLLFCRPCVAKVSIAQFLGCRRQHELPRCTQSGRWLRRQARPTSGSP